MQANQIQSLAFQEVKIPRVRRLTARIIIGAASVLAAIPTSEAQESIISYPPPHSKHSLHNYNVASNQSLKKSIPITNKIAIKTSKRNC